ncbi:MAG TPA: class I SAM-dependent methyltransferase [Gemmatimonadaceae bacterium]|nr:class I SAM-dependent methyltransferase [Gemmatimonadaceae bacterium]
MASVGWVVALGAGVAFVVERLKREKLRASVKMTGAFLPLPTVTLAEIDPVFTPGPYGPTLATEVAFIGHGPVAVPGGTSDAEAWILAVLAKHSRSFFEFGTCTGRTSYLWSRNAPADARIVTLTLAPTQRDAYVAADGDEKRDIRFALDESNFTEFIYTGTPEAERITQLFGDSKAFDESPYVGWADLVFVDGSHARSYVLSDSAKALRIVKPGGLVLWHDYAGPHHAPGVFDGLNALVKTLPIRHLRGTTFAAYRRPLDG